MTYENNITSKDTRINKDIITGAELKQYLETLSDNYPEIIIKELSKGSVIKKSAGLEYVIDDPNIDRRLGHFPDGAVPYKKIYETLKSSLEGILKVFNNSSRINFSKVFNARVGQCLEKAILVQLAAQRARPSFLINGYLSVKENGEKEDVKSPEPLEPHAYNIVFKDGKPFLVDVENPLINPSTGKIIPYIVPILGIDNEEHTIILSKEYEKWRVGRIYYLF